MSYRCQERKNGKNLPRSVASLRRESDGWVTLLGPKGAPVFSLSPELMEALRAGEGSPPAPSKPPRRWQEDEGFCAWLERQEYQALTDGQKMYCWEAWLDAQARA